MGRICSDLVMNISHTYIRAAIFNRQEIVRDCLQDFFLYLKKNMHGFGETNSINLPFSSF